MKKKRKCAIARKAVQVRNRLEKARKTVVRVAQASSLKKKRKGAIAWKASKK